jgi:hypothetical protein
LVSGLTDPVCNECVFVSFGVEGSENGNGGHGGWVGSVFVTARRFAERLVSAALWSRNLAMRGRKS